jgi:hypothetical protein
MHDPDDLQDPGEAVPAHELPLAGWFCAVCGSENETPVDAALGLQQKFTEDCRVCCRPNLLRIRIHSAEDMSVDVEFDE